jgi:hypothetical protein
MKKGYVLRFGAIDEELLSKSIMELWGKVSDFHGHSPAVCMNHLVVTSHLQGKTFLIKIIKKVNI